MHIKVVELPVDAITLAVWNPNRMSEASRTRLRRSIQRFDFVVLLVVRATGKDRYETVGGAERLVVARELGYTSVPCVVVTADDTEARLLSQALNRIHGEDDLGLKAELIKELLERLTQEEVLAVLPETADSLKALASLGQDTIAQQLQAWQQAQEARLRHLQFHLLPSQLEIVEEALAKLLPKAREVHGESPNARSTALYLICKAILEKGWYK